MGSYRKQHAMAARELGLRAARRMALLSATIPHDQLDETNHRESEVLNINMSLMADELALQPEGARSSFEAAVGEALNEETDRILRLITRGPRSTQ